MKDLVGTRRRGGKGDLPPTRVSPGWFPFQLPSHSESLLVFPRDTTVSWPGPFFHAPEVPAVAWAAPSTEAQVPAL